MVLTSLHQHGERLRAVDRRLCKPEGRLRDIDGLQRQHDEYLRDGDEHEDRRRDVEELQRRFEGRLVVLTSACINMESVSVRLTGFCVNMRDVCVIWTGFNVNMKSV